jgi:hypothetical protein
MLGGSRDRKGTIIHSQDLGGARTPEERRAMVMVLLQSNNGPAPGQRGLTIRNRANKVVSLVPLAIAAAMQLIPETAHLVIANFICSGRTTAANCKES